MCRAVCQVACLVKAENNQGVSLVIYLSQVFCVSASAPCDGGRMRKNKHVTRYALQTTCFRIKSCNKCELHHIFVIQDQDELARMQIRVRELSAVGQIPIF